MITAETISRPSQNAILSVMGGLYPCLNPVLRNENRPDRVPDWAVLCKRREA